MITSWNNFTAHVLTYLKLMNSSGMYILITIIARRIIVPAFMHVMTFKFKIIILQYSASICVSIFLYFKPLFRSPSYYAWGTLVIIQIFDFRFLANLHILVSGESKKYEISMVSRCSLVSQYVCQYFSQYVRLIACGDDIF